MSHLVQGSKEWLEYRKNKIGASDCPIVLGISPYATPHQLWRRKLGFEPEQAMSSAMQEGHRREDDIRKMFQKETGHIVIPAVMESKDHPFMMASLDGLDMDETLFAEIKYNNKDFHSVAKSGSVVDHHFAQMQHQFAVLPNIEQAYYVSFNSGDLAIVAVKRDSGFILNVVKKEAEFFQQMTDLIAPALTERDVVERSDLKWQNLVDAYKQTKERLKELEDRESDLRRKIMAECGNCNVRGFGLQATKFYSKGAVQYGSIPELSGVNLDLYRKTPIEKWRITTM